jgi:hypothetical protein
MRKKTLSRMVLPVMLLAILLVSGCTAVIRAPVPPPPPRRAWVPPPRVWWAPAPRGVWVPGHWGVRGHWVPGHWRHW